MKVTKKISQKLNDYMTRTNDLKIAGWLFNFDDGKSIGLGLYDNKLGGPYTPPERNDVYIGAAYIRWADGTISDVKINAPVLENLDASLKEWKSVSYHDEDAPDILEPLPMPNDLKIKDPKIIDLITKDSSYFFEILNFYNKELMKRDYTKTTQGEVKAEYRHVTIMNSKGLNVEWEETSMKTSAYANYTHGNEYVERRRVKKKDLWKIIKEIDRYMVHDKKIVNVWKGRMPIILVPGTVDAFLEQYLLSNGGNLQGDRVAHNQSLYNIEDFKKKKQVFDERINLVVDSLKDYSPGTQPCTGEGVPSTKQYVVADGRLITPILDLKYAKKIGMPPTALGKRISPTTSGTIYLDVKEDRSYSKMVEELEYGLIVFSVLGMHTQNSKEGKYSLTIGQGLLVEDGKIKGSIKNTTIKGNFLEALRNKETKFAKYRKDELAMQTEASVIV